MSTKTYVIVSTLTGIVVSATEAAIPLFNLSNESAVLAAVGAVGTAVIAVTACFKKNETKSE